MKTIVFASSKGGVGKTTLAFNCAIEAMRHGSVFLADMDPQKSLDDLIARRTDGAEIPEQGIDTASAGNDMVLLEDVGSIQRAVRDLVARGYARDFLIVDTPGSFMNIIEDAIAAADALVLPLQPSPLDILAQEAVVGIAKRLGKLDRTLLVLNRVDSRSSISDETFQRIGGLTPHAPVRISQRVDYARAMIAGRAGNEINPDARREIEMLWQTIERIAGVASKPTTRRASRTKERM